MTIDEVNAQLRTTGMPVAYDHFLEKTPLPHIAFREMGTVNLAADGVVYHSIRRIRAELYTTCKDTDAEALVEAALSSFVWERGGGWIASEKCYMTTYDFEV